MQNKAAACIIRPEKYSTIIDYLKTVSGKSYHIERKDKKRAAQMPTRIDKGTRVMFSDDMRLVAEARATKKPERRKDRTVNVPIGKIEFFGPFFESEMLTTNAKDKKGGHGRGIYYPQTEEIRRLDHLINKQENADPKDAEQKTPRYAQFESFRFIRDTKMANDLKKQYDHSCQVCNEAIELPNGDNYSEGHHIRSIGQGGDDVKSNLLVLCPNHHLEFDKCVMYVDDDCETVQRWNGRSYKKYGTLKFIDDHYLDRAYVRYQLKLIEKILK